jgi:predicted lipoprotein with Yx(FWY)xxD motif
MLGISNRGLVVGALVVLAGLVAGCGGGGYGSGPGTTGTHKTAPASTRFSSASVSGVGTVLADKGRTVYILTKDGSTNVPCTAASGCTAVWPPVGAFNGWRLYEYTGDTGSGQANGQGIKSFGGTWYVLSPSGQPVKSSSSSGGGYGGGGY